MTIEHNNKGGAPKGNRNAVKHGLTGRKLDRAILGHVRADAGGVEAEKPANGDGRHGNTIGTLPKGFEWLTRRLCEYRRILEAAVRDAGREITVDVAAMIDGAVMCQMQRLKAQHYLRQGSTLPPAEQLKLDKIIVDATLKRNAQIARLKLGRDALNDAGSLYGDD